MAGLTSRDRAAIAKIVDLDPEDYSPDGIRRLVRQIATNIRGARERDRRDGLEPGPGRYAGLLRNNLHHLALRVSDHAAYRALAGDDPAVLVDGVHTAGRLHYLRHTHDYRQGYTGGHVWDVLDSLAVPDDALLDRYRRRWPPPFRGGHPVTDRVADAVFGLLDPSPAAREAVAARVAPALEHATVRGSDRALLVTLHGIATGEAGRIGDGLAELLHHHRRQERLKATPMLAFVGLPAHGLYRLALRAMPPEATARLRPPEGRGWDAALHAAVDTAGPRLLDVVAEEDLLLAGWLDRLPDELDGTAYATG
jgi:hypothetical protein